MFNIFGSKPAQPAAAPAQPTGQAQVAGANPSINPVTTDGTAPNGVVPDNVNTPASPLDAFKDMWNNDPNAKQVGKYTPEVLDPAKLQEIMGKVDLTKSITPENLAAIQAGGEGATAALLATLNSVSQQAMVNSTMVANKMVEDQSTKLLAAFEAKLPSMLKEHNLSNALNEQNPIYSNPAVAPIMEAVKSQLSNKFPNATTQELTKMAQDYVKATSLAFNPAPVDTGVPKGEIDWSNFENQ